MERLAERLISRGSDDGGTIGEVIGKCLLVNFTEAEIAFGFALAKAIDNDIAIASSEHFQNVRRRCLAKVRNDMTAICRLKLPQLGAKKWSHLQYAHVRIAKRRLEEGRNNGHHWANGHSPHHDAHELRITAECERQRR